MDLILAVFYRTDLKCVSPLTLRTLMRLSVSCLISMALMILSSADRSELYRMSEISLRVN